MSFRKEKKFRLSHSDLISIQTILFNKGMSELHPPRVINSCYFDTSDLSLFQESEEGVLPRKKIRVRWYDSEDKFTKEIKISSVEGRFKVSEKIEKIYSVNEVQAFNFFDQDYGLLKSKVIVSYQREYFSLEGLRITFDTGIKYQDVRKANTSFIKDDECVMEVKVPIDVHDDYIENLVHHSTSRFSKYSRALLKSESLI